MSDLGPRIRHRRRELRLSLRALGVKCGLSASYLSELETGKRGVGADSLLAISEVLGLPLDQLMKGGEPQTSGPLPAGLSLPSSLMRFGSEADLPFRQILCLFWMARTIMDHRTNGRRADLELFDWTRFHGVVKDFF